MNKKAAAFLPIGIGVGVSIGTALGLALDNLALGVAGMGAVQARSGKEEDSDDKGGGAA